MLSLNRAQLIGNLTRDPEIRYTPTGKPVVTFGVATNRVWIDSEGNKQKSVEYHEIVSWGKLAEICNQILRKGYQVFVEGRLHTRTWEAQDGTKRQRTEIILENMKLLSRPRTEPTKEENLEEIEEQLETELSEKEEKPLEEELNEVSQEDIEDIPF